MIVTADKTTTDGLYYNVLRRLNVDLPMLLLSRRDELDFNEQVLDLAGKDYVCVDLIENGWDVDFHTTLLVGKNTDKFPFLKGEGWQRLHEFMKANLPKLYLKRELLKWDESDTVKPIEYPNFQPNYPLELSEEFNARPISSFFYWGRSHEARLILQGETWKYAARKGGAVCDTLYNFNAFIQHETNPLKFVTLNIEHYSRVDIAVLMSINAMSKLSISLYGCGRKCFRNTGESVVNSICVLPEDNLAYSYPFVHNVNCIKFSTNGDVTGLKKEWDVMGAVEEALKNPNLYDIYLESKKIADFYQIESYATHLEKLINNA